MNEEPEVIWGETVPITWRLGHRPSLDALRGIAVLMVLLGHTLLPADLGGAGVTLFFVLSGYLITAILIGEHRETGRIALRSFYGRRARRLLPALGLLLIVVGVRAAMYGDFFTWLPDGLAVAFYVGNWAWAAGAPMPGLAHTWSLAIEEQFYLLWPIALVLMLRLGIWRTSILTAVLIALSLALTVASLDNYRIAAVGFHTRANELLIGCLIALVSAYSGRDLRVPTPMAGIAFVGFVALWLSGQWQASFLVAWIPAGIMLAWWAARPAFLAWRPLTWTGRVSYGLYLFHFPIALGPLNYFDGLDPVPRGISIIVASYILAGASWFLVERRFLAPGRRSTTSPFAKPVGA